MAFSGLLIAIGGGILRDVFVNEIPIVFVKELYASASFVGVVTLFGLLVANFELNVAAVSSIAAVTGLRLLAMRYSWNLPRAKAELINFWLLLFIFISSRDFALPLYRNTSGFF